MAEDTKPQADSKPQAEQPKPTKVARPKVKHFEGCPADAERVEQYDTDRVNRDHTTTPFTVTRCLDCGAHEAKQK